MDVIARALAAEIPHALRVQAARHAISMARAHAGGLRDLTSEAAAHEEILQIARSWLAKRERPSLRRVINATGVVIHTNLGRAPLPAEAVAAALGYCNLEYDLEAGQRGSRRALIEPLLCELTGAPAALVANNCAAALMLALAALSVDKRQHPTVLVSRGELVEIGGSFRIPAILQCAGVALREVGTTNRTYASDYAGAIDADVVAVLRVHPSNFKQTGFVARPTLAELRAAAGVLPLIVDLGSDALYPIDVPASRDDDPLHEALALADLVTLSGDKLVGGPQAGIALGQTHLIERMASHPLMRALRPDKLTIGALDYVLRARLAQAPQRVPVLRMIALTQAELRARAERLAAAIPDASVVDTQDPIGGGSHPEMTLPGAGIALAGPQPDARVAALRCTTPPVIATIHKDQVIIALRTVSLDDEAELVAALLATARSSQLTRVTATAKT